MQKEKPGLTYIYNAINAESRAFLATIEKFEETYSDQLVVNRIDVYKSTGLADRLGIHKFPAVVTTVNGEISKTFIDEMNVGEIETELNKICK